MKGCTTALVSVLLLLATTASATTQERVVDLPQDQDRAYLTIFGSENDWRFQRLVTWFDRVPDLREIRDRVHFNAIDVRSKLFEQRYAGTTPYALHVRMQGGEAQQADIYSREIPATPAELLAMLRWRFLDRFRCDSPIQRPNQDPEPQPLNTPKQKQPEPKPEPASRGWQILFALAIAIGGGGAAYQSYQETYAAKK